MSLSIATSPQITRRQFLKLTLAGAGTVGAAPAGPGEHRSFVQALAGHLIPVVNAASVHRRISLLESRLSGPVNAVGEQR